MEFNIFVDNQNIFEIEYHNFFYKFKFKILTKSVIRRFHHVSLFTFLMELDKSNKTSKNIFYFYVNKKKILKEFHH